MCAVTRLTEAEGATAEFHLWDIPTLTTTSNTEKPRDLLTLREASDMLEVHPATLRTWADQGKLPVYRTAGGHRRFALEDVQALRHADRQPVHRQNIETLIYSALGRTRMQISEGKLSAQGIYAHYDEAAREQHRRLGQRLLRLVMHALSSDTEARLDVDHEIQVLGRLYAQMGKRNHLSLRDAVQVFLVFRDMLLESALQAATGQSPSSDALSLYRQINGLVDQILLAMVDNYER